MIFEKRDTQTDRHRTQPHRLLLYIYIDAYIKGYMMFLVKVGFLAVFRHFHKAKLDVYKTCGRRQKATFLPQKSIIFIPYHTP